MDELHDLTAAYALDALDADETRAYEAHLATCERCRAELTQLVDAASALAYATGGVAPPSHLREQILTQARAERTNVVPLRPRRWAPRGLSSIAAAAACLVVGLGIWNVTLQHRLDRKDALASILGDPQAHRVPVKGTTGELVVSRSGAALVTALGHAPSGKTYEAWFMRDGKATRVGTFGHGGAFVLDGHPSKGTLVGVTVEKAGGVDKPTGKPIALATA